ncbi:MAG TPA: galactose-1-epimerase, partial [Paludibacteraceae bacterium]|nr:galactose-1-epimerase [Paludibacteraceae bacterium]
MKPENFNEKIDGKQISLFTLKNRQGMTAQITNYGGRVVSLWVPDKKYDFKDVITGYSSLKGFQQSTEVYFGALIGRYGNRIAKGRFELNGKTYQLPINDGENHLHGGPKGFHTVI